MQILKALRVHLPAEGESTKVFIYISVIFIQNHIDPLPMALLMLSSSRALCSPSLNVLGLAWPCLHCPSLLRLSLGWQQDLVSTGLCGLLTNIQKPSKNMCRNKFKEQLNLIQLSEFPWKDRTGWAAAEELSWETLTSGLGTRSIFLSIRKVTKGRCPFWIAACKALLLFWKEFDRQKNVHFYC